MTAVPATTAGTFLRLLQISRELPCQIFLVPFRLIRVVQHPHRPTGPASMLLRLPILIT